MCVQVNKHWSGLCIYTVYSPLFSLILCLLLPLALNYKKAHLYTRLCCIFFFILLPHTTHFDGSVCVHTYVCCCCVTFKYAQRRWYVDDQSHYRMSKWVSQIYAKINLNLTYIVPLSVNMYVFTVFAYFVIDKRSF